MKTKSDLIKEFKDLKSNNKTGTKRGFAFERLINELLEIENLKPSFSYKPTGEQIDGMFEFNLKLFAVPLLIINVFEASRVRVGILKNGSLTLDKRVRNINYWLLIIFSSRSWATYDMEFARMNEIVVD